MSIGPPARVEVAWAIQLVGHPFDLEELAHWTHGNSIYVEKVAQELYRLVLPISEVGKNYEEVKARATTYAASLNGALALLSSGFRPVQLSPGMITINQQGIQVSVWLAINGCEARAKCGRVGLAVNGIVVPDPTLGAAGKFCALAESSAGVRDALLLVGRHQPLWSELYVAMELVKANCRTTLEESGWIDRDRLDLFRHTVNNYTALGAQARHGPSKHKPPGSPMTQHEATALIRGLVHEWIKTLLV